MMRELRSAARALWRDRSATLLAVMVLGLGLAGTSVFFALVNAAVLRGLGIPESNRVLFIATRNAQDRPTGLSLPEFDDLSRTASRLNPVAAYVSMPMTIGEPGTAPERLFGTYMSSAGFSLLRVAPALGRVMSRGDDAAGAPAVVFIGADVWQSRYGGDVKVIGRSITINGRPATIAGVMPAGFKFPTRTDIWVPLRAWPDVTPARRAARMLSVFGRVASGATPTAAGAEIDAIARRWSTDLPAEYRGLRVTTTPIDAALLGRVSDRVWLGFITVGALVSIIACANVATLLLVRGIRRERDFAVRTALGATRTRIVRQVTLEASVIAGAAGLLALVLSAVTLKALAATVPSEGLPYWFRIAIDLRVIAALGVMCLGSVLVAGLLPAVHVSLVDGESLRSSRHVTSGKRTQRWIGLLVATEIALTLALVAAVGSAIRNTRVALLHERSLDPAPLLTFSVTLPPARFDTADKRLVFVDSLRARVAALPSVVSATAATALPRAGGPVRDLELFERPLPPGASKSAVVTVGIDDRYFDVLDVRLLRGRSFSATDGAPGGDTAIVNQRFADVYWPGADPIGGRIRLRSTAAGSEASSWLTIVGVAPTVRQRLAGVMPDPVVYLPLRAAAPVTTAMMIRASGDPVALTAAVREQLRQLDPTVPLDRPMTLERAFNEVEWTSRVANWLLDGIGAIALALALVGLYAVIAQSVGQRRREFGIRLALGATPLRLGREVLGRAALYVLVATPVGLLFTWWLDRLLSDPAGTQHLTDAIVLGPVIAFVFACGTAACLAPARSAMRADPATTLRVE
jgi:predicted permease